MAGVQNSRDARAGEAQDHIEAHLDGRNRLPGAPMSAERIKAVREQLTIERCEADRREAQRWDGRLQAELEKHLPADVPLHKRGFGVMGGNAMT